MSSATDTQLASNAIPKGEQSNMLLDRLEGTSAVNRGGRIFFGSALVISAIGLWLIPVTDGDAAMQLIKLLISVMMVSLGMMFIFSLRQSEDLPEVQVDLAKRELRVLKLNRADKSYVEATHSFDSLGRITLEDCHLSAEDAEGNLLVSVPLRDEETAAALREALRDLR